MSKRNLVISSVFGISTLLLSELLPISGQAPLAQASLDTVLQYSIGTPSVQEYWLSPTGNDTNNGDQNHPIATFGHAWELVPMGTTLQTGFLFHVMPGTYNSPDLWVENRHGTANAPIIFQGDGSVQINGNLNSDNLHYIYFINLTYTYAHDLMHFADADHILLRNVTLHSPGGAQETLKVNQTQYMYVEDSDISGAWDNAIDFVAVQHGHVVRSKVHGSSDWCMYTKGGSAYIRVDSNEFFNCGTGGFTAGQGTGLQFMTYPWLQYEAYDIKVTNNIIHDTQGAGLGVNGGYNILMAYNTLYNIGKIDHLLEFVYGGRSCDGNDAAACTPNLQKGAWGSTSDAGVDIGNKHIYFYNNIAMNAPGYMTAQWPAQFAIYGPRTLTVAGSQGPNPAYDDIDLQIKGNILWSPGADLGVSGENGCATSNPTCNPTQLLRDNAINTVQPQFTNAAGYDFSLPTNSNVFTVASYPIPTFNWSDVPDSNTPAGNFDNTVSQDRLHNIRTSTTAGAIIGVSSTPTTSPTPTSSPSPTVSPTPTTSPTPTVSPTPTTSPSPTVSPTPTTSPTPSTSPSPTVIRLADIEGYWNNVDKICSTNRRNVINCSLRSSLHPFNAGNIKSVPAVIGVYLSANKTLDNSDTLIKTVSMKAINPGTGIAINFSYSGPVDYVNKPYLIAKFDNSNLIPESNETNNLATYSLR